MIEKAWNFKEFYQIWFDMLPKYETCESAYEELEKQFAKKYGRRRFKNYNTFKVMKSRYLSKK